MNIHVRLQRLTVAADPENIDDFSHQYMPGCIDSFGNPVFISSRIIFLRRLLSYNFVEMNRLTDYSKNSKCLPGCGTQLVMIQSNQL